MAQEQHLFPFVCRTIRTPIAYAFVAVAGTGESGTWNIKQNATDSTFLLHAFLMGWGIEGSLILPIHTNIAKKADIFGSSMQRMPMGRRQAVGERIRRLTQASTVCG